MEIYQREPTGREDLTREKPWQVVMKDDIGRIIFRKAHRFSIDALMQVEDLNNIFPQHTVHLNKYVYKTMETK